MVTAPLPAITAPVANELPVVEEMPSVVEAPVDQAPVVAAPVAAAPVLQLAAEAPVAKAQGPIGEVYVYASSGSYDVLLKGKVIHAPALLKLPITTASITVRKTGSSETSQVAVEPRPGRPMMVRVD